MTNIKLAFIFFLSTLSCFGQNIDQLKVEQPLLKRLLVWNGLIIAEKDWSRTDKYYVCDTIKNRLTRLQIANDTAILDLTETPSSLHVIVQRDDSYFLLTKNKHERKWTTNPLFPDFNKIKKFRLVANDNLLLIITFDEIFFKQPNSTWEKIAIDSLIDEFHTNDYDIPQHCLMTSNSLYLGYDNGEWGGALVEIPISKGDNKTFGKGKFIIEDNIKGLEYSSKGTLWIASGLSHLAIRESGIYTFQKDKLQQVLWPQPRKSKDKPQQDSVPQMHLLFGEKSDLSAFCLKDKEVPLFIMSEFGVFRIQKDSIEEVIKTKLNIEYSLEKGYSAGSRPVGMQIDNNSTIFIAQRSLGVFVYIRNKDSYTFRQISFD